MEDMRSLRTFSCLSCCLWATVLLGLAGIGRAGDDDPFSLANKAGPKATPDPFSLEYQAKLSAKPESEPPSAKPLSRASQKLATLIEFTAKVTPAHARPGEIVHVTVTGKPKATYHTYPITQRTPEQNSLQLSKLKLVVPAGLKPLWPITESKPEFVVEPAVGVLLEHNKEFTWSQDVLILPEAKPGSKVLGISIFLQV